MSRPKRTSLPTSRTAASLICNFHLPLGLFPLNLASVGVVKALSGIVATILLTLGVDVVGSTPIVQSELKTTAASVLYGVYLLGSTMQAFLTQKKLAFA